MEVVCGKRAFACLVISALAVGFGACAEGERSGPGGGTLLPTAGTGQPPSAQPTPAGAMAAGPQMPANPGVQPGQNPGNMPPVVGEMPGAMAGRSGAAGANVPA